MSDENKNPIDGADVSVEWKLPDGSIVSESKTTSGKGEASFRIRGEGGIYTITVTNISKGEYVFDPDNSVLTASRAWF